MNIKELKNKFENGLIQKPEYIKKIYDFHRILFDYAEFIKNTDIKKIEITDDKIITTTRENAIKMICEKK